MPEDQTGGGGAHLKIKYGGMQNHMRALIHMAWADGQLSPNEQTLIHKYFRKLGLSESEAERALMSEPEEEPDWNALPAEIPNPLQRLELIRALMELSFCDDVLTGEEYTIVEKVAKLLGVGEDELERLRQEVS